MSSDQLAPIDRLTGLVKAGSNLVIADTTDIEWIDTLAERLAERVGMLCYRWSLASGLVPLCLKGVSNPGLRKPDQIITFLRRNTQPCVIVMSDIAYTIDDELVRSGLRDLMRDAKDNPNVLILPGVNLELPADLNGYAVPFDPGLPNIEQLREVLIEEANRWGDRNQRRARASNADIDAVVRNLLGLTRSEARRLVRAALVDGIIDSDDVSGVITGKHELLARSGSLTFEPHVMSMQSVAGMHVIKKWLKERKSSFLDEDPRPGLDKPKGILLLGVQGGGKSLLAKAVPGAWGVPLLKLDMGAIYNKYHGETERNLRESLQAADVMSPCVLWIDEIEKGLATDDNNDVSKRVLGTLLTWLQDRRSRVFVVATANDITSLPPELMRKGRFDEIFFVDLPTREVRKAVFEIHLERRELEPDRFDLDALSFAAVGFTGAEIEQVVVSAAYAANSEETEITDQHLMEAVGSTKPLSVVRAEDLAALRRWAEGRTVSADIDDECIDVTSTENES